MDCDKNIVFCILFLVCYLSFNFTLNIRVYCWKFYKRKWKVFSLIKIKISRESRPIQSRISTSRALQKNWFSCRAFDRAFEIPKARLKSATKSTTARKSLINYYSPTNAIVTYAAPPSLYKHQHGNSSQSQNYNSQQWKMLF